jgi:hypothetical protein
MVKKMGMMREMGRDMEIGERDRWRAEARWR